MQVADPSEVSVIVVNYNSTELLRKCLESIAIFGQGVPTQTIVVDNASTDEDPRGLAAEYPWITLVANRQNVGYARANNQGMRLARGKYVLLLNPDAELLEGSLATMVCYMDAHPEVGVVGPRLLNSDGTLQPSSYRFPRLTEVAVSLFGLRRLFPMARLRRSPVGEMLARTFRHFLENLRVEEVDWVTGACMLLRRSAVDSVGMLDEAYFMYFEEIDWCRRFKRHGWSVTHLPTAVALHHIGQSSVGHNGRVFLRRFVSGSYYFAKHHGRVCLLTVSLIGFASGVGRLAGACPTYLLRRMDRRDDVNCYWETVRYAARVLFAGGTNEWVMAHIGEANKRLI